MNSLVVNVPAHNTADTRDKQKTEHASYTAKNKTALCGRSPAFQVLSFLRPIESLLRIEPGFEAKQTAWSESRVVRAVAVRAGRWQPPSVDITDSVGNQYNGPSRGRTLKSSDI